MADSNPPSISGSKSAIYQDIKFSKPMSAWNKVTAILAVLFFITTVIFVIVFAYYYTKYNDQESGAKFCNTPDCTIAAAAIVRKMNLSIDPCVDFGEYACGRFIKELVLPDGKTRMGSFNVAEDENKIVMKDIIIDPVRTAEPRYLSNMKRLYRSCVDEAKIEQIGLSLYIKDTSFTMDWPTLNANWSQDNFNVNDVIERYMQVYTQPLFSYFIESDMMDSNKKALYLDEPSLGLPQEYFRRPESDRVIQAYKRYLADVAVALGANKTDAERDASDVADLEIRLAKAMVPTVERRDPRKEYNPVALSELSKLYTNIDIPRALRAAFNTANISLSDNETIINRYPTYIGNMSLVISQVSNRTLQNLFGFKYALSRITRLTRKMRDVSLEFDKVYSGNTAERPRWEVCLDESSGAFWEGMSKQFVARKFPESAKKYMNEMIDNLEEQFKLMIQESTWMGQSTKDEAYKKLASIKAKIGYPDTNFQDVDIEKKYENYNMSEDSYYMNLVLSKTLSNLKELRSLQKPVDKNEWQMPPYMVNAYYSGPGNEIAFPAGILQPPFFSQTFQDSMNYGAIGVVIGHEITHGFDDQGSRYDADGNLRDWWQKSDQDNFVQRKQCIIDQNSKFYISEINMTLNGINTQGESVADNGGVKESFRAYRELVRKKGEHPSLPGLELTQDQLFFLAYGQLWCEKMTKERLISQVVAGVHPPGKYRIIGPLQNSEDFAKAYNCDKGKYMNPNKKCSVW